MLRDTILHKRGTMSSPQPIVKLSPREAALMTFGVLQTVGKRRERSSDARPPFGCHAEGTLEPRNANSSMDRRGQRVAGFRRLDSYFRTLDVCSDKSQRC